MSLLLMLANKIKSSFFNLIITINDTTDFGLRNFLFLS